MCVSKRVEEISQIKIWINAITATYFLTAIKNKDTSRKWIILGVLGDTENFRTPFSWKRTVISCLFSRQEVKIVLVAWEPDSSFSVTHVRGLPVPYPGNSYRWVSQSLSLSVFCYQGMELRLTHTLPHTIVMPRNTSRQEEWHWVIGMPGSDINRGDKRGNQCRLRKATRGSVSVKPMVQQSDSDEQNKVICVLPLPPESSK